MPATVVPIRPGVVGEPPRERRAVPPHPKSITAPCPACGLPAYPLLHDYRCDRCDTAVMHDPCYWGRVASLEEWRAYLTLLDGDDDNPTWPPTVCPACRANGGT